MFWTVFAAIARTAGWGWPECASASTNLAGSWKWIRTAGALRLWQLCRARNEEILQKCSRRIDAFVSRTVSTVLTTCLRSQARTVVQRNGTSQLVPPVVASVCYSATASRVIASVGFPADCPANCRGGQQRSQFLTEIARHASSRRHVAFCDVVHHHTIGVEAPAQGSDGTLHALDPAPRQTVAIAIVIERDHFFAQDVVQIFSIAIIVNAHVGMGSAGSDGESIQTVVGLGPPAVEHRQVKTAVQNHLLTAGA